MLAAVSFVGLALIHTNSGKVILGSSMVKAQELQPPQSCQDVPVPNPLQVAINRWYHRNQTARIPVQGPAFALAFDGDQMYVVGPGIQKIRASDAATLATFNDFGTLEVSSLTGPVAFDGTNLWVALTASDAGLAVIRASDGKFLSSGSTPLPHLGIVFDGASVWLTSPNGQIEKFHLVNGNVSQSATIVQPAPVGITFDGQNIWVADQSGVVYERRNTDGSVVRTVSIGGQPMAATFDGVNVWVTDRASGVVAKVRVSDGAVLGKFSTQKFPDYIVFDGAFVWTANTGSNSLTKIRACDGSASGNFALGGTPTGLAFDGSNVWVATTNGFVAKF
jgi:hypothetical protein